MPRKNKRPLWHTYLGKLLRELSQAASEDQRRDDLNYVTGYIAALLLARVIESRQEERLTAIKKRCHQLAIERSKTP